MHPVLLFLVSIAAGFVGAMSGMGGGVVLVPALTLLGIDIKHAIAISIVSVIATSSGSAAAYVRDHITNLKVGMFLEMFTIVGALVGAAITVAINPNLLFLAFGLVLLASWTALFLQRNEAWQPGRARGRLLALAGAERVVLRPGSRRADQLPRRPRLLRRAADDGRRADRRAARHRRRRAEGPDPRPGDGPAAESLDHHQQPDHRRHGAGRHQRLPGRRPDRSRAWPRRSSWASSSAHSSARGCWCGCATRRCAASSWSCCFVLGAQMLLRGLGVRL